MSQESRNLLHIAEIGGYAGIDQVFSSAQFRVETCSSVRVALKTLKRTSFDIIVADFHYQPTYSMIVSNLDALLATVSGKYASSKMVLFCLPDDRHHLDKLLHQFQNRLTVEILDHPVNMSALSETLQNLCSFDEKTE